MADNALVHETSYIIETNPETASVNRTSLFATGVAGCETNVSSITAAGSVSRVVFSDRPDNQKANNPMATLTVAMINVVRIFPRPGINTKAAASVPAAAPNVFSA